VIWRGDLHDVDLGRPVGHEPAFRRPAVVISADLLNHGPGGLVAVVPVGSADHGLRSHVPLEPGAGTGLRRTSFARCDQLRFVASQRLSDRRGAVAREELMAIERALRFVLGL